TTWGLAHWSLTSAGCAARSSRLVAHDWQSPCVAWDTGSERTDEEDSAYAPAGIMVRFHDRARPGSMASKRPTVHNEPAGQGLKRSSPGPILMYAVTAPETAIHFLRGQLSYMSAKGYDVHLLCWAADSTLRDICANEGVTLHTV